MHYPLWEKLWDKGVDIAASIISAAISAGIVALIATLTWRWKRKRDLALEDEKARQHERIAREFTEKDRLARLETLKSELGQLVANFDDVSRSMDEARALIVAWDSWLKWLERNNLQDLPSNSKLVQYWEGYGIRQGNNNVHNIRGWAEKIKAAINASELH